MTAEFLRRIIVRDLMSLHEEIGAYPDEQSLWDIPPGVTNSAGTLVLHLIGNLRHFIGAALGGSDYVRDRRAEFSSRDVPREELEAGIEATIAVVDDALRRISETDLAREYPLEVAGTRLSTGLFLTHLAVHLAYHLGQVDYHRRVVTGESKSVGALSVAALSQDRR